MSVEVGEIDERVYRVIEFGSGVGTLVAFTFVGFAALDSLAYGVAAGLLTGVGSALFVPWFMRLAATEEDRPLADRIESAPGKPGRRLFGLGLDMGGIVMLAVGLAFGPNLLVGAAAGLSVALAVSLVGSVGIDRVGSPSA